MPKIVDKAHIVPLWRHNIRDRRRKGGKKISEKEIGEMGFSFPFPEIYDVTTGLWRIVSYLFNKQQPDKTKCWKKATHLLYPPCFVDVSLRSYVPVSL